jgi:hypothetical protein
MKKLDLTNKKFGKLTAISVAHYKNKRCWNCICECGKTKIYPTFQLTNGLAKSCGCLRISDLTGQKFGSLTVIARTKNKRGRIAYKCICECGNINEYVDGAKLKDGKKKNCGKHKRVVKLGPRLANDLAAKNKIWSSYISNAKKKKHEITITKEFAIKLFSSNCFYCNAEPSKVIKNHGKIPIMKYNGIDRLDNTKGYVENNVVPCCARCNYKKSSDNKIEFILWIKKVYEKLNLENLDLQG